MIQSLPALRRQFFAENRSFYALPEDDPRSVRPLSLEQLKKQAKDLLKQLRRTQHWDRLHAGHPNAETLTPNTVALSHAQFVIAREQGFASWPQLKHHIEAEAVSRKAILNGQPSAMDGDMATLHIRCGNDVMYKLAVSGFVGDFLMFADPYIQGPVPNLLDLDAFIRLRAGFLGGKHPPETARIHTELVDEYQALAETAKYERVALWFEHDAYDVLIFCKLLHDFSDSARRSQEVRFLCADHYPGVKRFNGIGQLPADAMRVLWTWFQPVDEAQFQYGGQCWRAYIAPTPETFCRLAFQETPPLPEIVPALRRHLQELPWRTDGLSLTERLTLKILAEQGPSDAARLFYHWYTTVYEPLVFMGDTSYWMVLMELADAQCPAIELLKASDKKVDWRLSLTDFGRRLLAGNAHWMDHNAYDRWFGGTHNESAGTIWYWDEESLRVMSGRDD